MTAVARNQPATHAPDLDAQFRTERIVSLAGFPIVADDKVQGLLFVADRYARDYTGREISVLGSFALHAGIAMRNASFFARLSEALEDAEHSRLRLEAHVHRVERSAEAHDEMMAMLAQGADLTRFLTRMAVLVEGAIQLRDAGLVVREEIRAPGYSGSLLDQLQDLDPTRIIAALSNSRANGRATLLHQKANERCLALALPGSTGPGDSLLICHEGESDDIQLRNLERSAVALSIAKLWSEKREAERQIASSTLLRHLVLVPQADAATVVAARDRLRQKPGQCLQLALFDLPSDGGEWLRQAAEQYGLLIDTIQGSHVALGPQAPLTDFCSSLLGATGILVEPFERLEGAAHQYLRASKMMSTMQRLGRLTRLLQAQEVSLFAQLFETAQPEQVDAFVQARVAAIDHRDPHQRAQLKTTLLCYFDNQFSLARTASEMGIHVNTVRQRLETLSHELGGWEDPVARSELHIALRLDHLSTVVRTRSDTSRS
ncbi:helix-turn-helix domain-containing protein [Paracoccus sp. DMF-8]|uniref:helix-turn-helix domain-containing protein n=1 Tax=Paracoccus sp. DMF-8 TaxID=3019445 RepID=UPI0023E375AB|nr:helix-turn-helix domain-containing protein [Paracoccus sp. DMF-8]MDF3608342.1 helix-turn-helix domain-containing protein [Paracoccus sp. DMF-8]